MEPSENSKEAEKLLQQVGKALKRLSISDASIPSKEKFLLTLKKFNELVSGHQSLLTAIGKL